MSEAKTHPRYPTLSIYAGPVEMEKAMIEWWDREEIFRKTQEVDASLPAFVFYDGPPTANGSPGVHHIISRLAKEQIAGAEQTVKAIQNISHVTQKKASSTDAVSQAVEAQSSSLLDVTKLASEIVALASTLDEEVRKFNLDKDEDD